MSKPAYNILAVTKFTRKDKEESRFTQVGVAFETKNGHLRLVFDFIPVGAADILLMPPKETAAKADNGPDDFQD